MRKTKNNSDRVAAEMLEMAMALRGHGLLSKADMGQIRALCAPPPVYSAETVVQIRTTKAQMSQSVFASFLNVSVSAVQKWESPKSGKHPSGSSAKLLQLIEKKGMEAVAI